jgi:hypothetical protein
MSREICCGVFTVLLLACASGGADAEDVAATPDLGDAGAVDDHAVEAVDTGPLNVDAAEDVPPFEPFTPPPLAEPAVDRAYVQELNHTSNEVEPGIGPLVAVLMPPEDHEGFDRPTQVTPRGIVRRVDGAVQVTSIPEADPDLIGAVASDGDLYVFGPQILYHLPAGGVLFPVPLAPGVKLHSAASQGAVAYLASDQGVWAVVGVSAALLIPDLSVSAVAAWQQTVLVGTEAGLQAFRLSPGLPPEPIWSLGTEQGLSVGAPVAILTELTLPRPLDLVVVGPDGLAAIELDADWESASAAAVVDEPWFAADRVPLGQARVAAVTSDGGLVVGAEGGACRLMERDLGLEWRVYNAERWLPSADVRGLWTSRDEALGPLWFATAGGLATVTAQEMTLAQKLEGFVERIVLRHDRDGAVADSRLTAKGDLSSSVPWDSDNDGGWTCYWVLSECFRWKVTGDPEAKAHFDKSLQAMLNLHLLTGTDHFLARSVIRKEGCQLDDCDDPDDGEWFTSPDGEWWVKADTSNDEVTSHMFMMGHAYDLCADEAQREGIRHHVTAVVGGIMDHGWQLVDLDGEVTTYGQFDPYYVHEHPGGYFGDGARRAAQILAALNLALHVSGEARFEAGKAALVEEHGYDEAVEEVPDKPGCWGSGDCDELGLQAFLVLTRYEQDPALRARWMSTWERSYEHLRLQEGALWDVTHAVMGGASPDLANAMRWLRRAPTDMIRWNQHNSQRQDLVDPPWYYEEENGAMRADDHPIPYDERRCDRWNTDQYRVDGGMGGLREMDGADVLMPYWMGRYYGFIAPE